MAIETYFEDIADAIRERGGTSAALTPAQMPQAIADIPGGGGGMTYHRELEPIKTDASGGYISGAAWYYDGTQNTKVDVYELTPGLRYFVHLGDPVGNRFRTGLFAIDPTTSTSTVFGTSWTIDNDSPRVYTIMKNNEAIMIEPNSTYKYLVVSKTNVGTSGIKSYVIEFNKNGIS